MSSTKQTTDDLVATLVKHIATVKYESLPADVVDITKKQILDTLGCCISGTSGLRMKELVDMIGAWGGKAESTIVGYGNKVPSPNAAFVNSTMGSIWDFDDCLDEAAIHAEMPVVTASFAAAERKGGVSGKDFMAAVAAGIDLGYRMTIATTIGMGMSLGWDYSVTYGYLTAAASSARVLGLDEVKVQHAMSLAYHQAGGAAMGGMPVNDPKIEAEGSFSSKELGRGFAAKGGLMGALLAEQGFTGITDFLTSYAGLYHTYMRDGYTPEVLIENLGKVFTGTKCGFKPYSSCRCNHACNDATIALVKEYNIKPQNVKKITPYISRVIMGVNCTPLHEKHDPCNPGACMFSLPWTIASSVVNRAVDPTCYGIEVFNRAEIIDVAHKVFPVYKPEFDSKGGMMPVIVEIETKDSKTYSKRVDYAWGSRENPMTLEDLIDKFRQCATTYAAKPMPKKKLDKILEMVMNMENVADVSEVVRLATWLRK